jgi:hypothetical protein
MYALPGREISVLQQQIDFLTALRTFSSTLRLKIGSAF